MRGVPRQRRAISAAAPASIGHVQQARRALHDRLQLRRRYTGFSRSTSPKRPRSGALTRPWRVVAPMAVNFGMGSECVRAPGPAPDQDIHAKILQRRVEHLLHVRQQAVNFVDEEDLARADVAEDAGEVELLLQHRPGGGGERHSSSSAMMAASVVLPRPGGP